ncbi:transposable element Tcb1 transposase [Trichonephila clavipes]|uniref:Transposable element Tcb1 transposase n=1 Tax=Trichonephila clavipes TaxID=2585209 RepID=A0A8X6RMP7_TRICX|nr:transposable element Tcb1 transposase [Trichonephila clavipes]
MTPRSHFSTKQFSASHVKNVKRLYPHCYYPSLACPILRFVSNRAYLGLFGMVSWASLEFERTGCKVTANMERPANMPQSPIVSHLSFALDSV